MCKRGLAKKILNRPVPAIGSWTGIYKPRTEAPGQTGPISHTLQTRSTPSQKKKKASRTSLQRQRERTCILQARVFQSTPAAVMRCSLVVAVALCALLCSASPAGAQVKAVKLCGREFLRAVVYTCGGSRWRRLLQDPESQTEGKPPTPNAHSPASPPPPWKNTAGGLLVDRC